MAAGVDRNPGLRRRCHDEREWPGPGCGRHAAVGHAYGDGVGARGLRWRRRPGEEARTGVNRSTSREARLQGKAQSLWRQVRIAGRDSEAQGLADRQTAVADGVDRRRRVARDSDGVRAARSRLAHEVNRRRAVRKAALTDVVELRAEGDAVDLGE